MLRRLVLFLVAFPALAETAPYLIKTRGPLPRRSVESVDARRFEIVDGYSAELTDEEVALLRKDPRVEWIEPDAERTIQGIGSTTHPRAFEAIPPGVTQVTAPKLWPMSTGKNIRVAILDTGIDFWHVDLAANYAGGFDFVRNDVDPEDETEFALFSHGTHVSGTIAAANNGYGIVGVAPDVKIYVLKVFQKSGVARSSEIIRAIEWSIANKMNILNCSFGGRLPVKLEDEAYRRAAAANLLILSASGNGSIGAVTYPAAYEVVMGVGAVDFDNSIASFSNWGPEVDLVAPGVSILSTTHTGKTRLARVTLSDGSIVSGTPVEGVPRGEASGRLVDASLGRPQDFSSASAGNIALIEIGQLGTESPEKISNARNAGASGVVLYQTRLIDCQVGLAPPDPLLPVSMCLRNEQGVALRQHAGTQVSVGVYVDDYSTFTGTSNAVPHVTGVAALLWSLVPDATAAQIREAMIATARDLGPPGRDEHYGYGLVDALAAARYLAPGRFPPPPRYRAIRR